MNVGVAAALCSLAGAASLAQAVQVSTSGRWVVGPLGSTAPANLGTAGSVTFSAGSGQDSLTGAATYSATRFGNQVCINLTLTNFVWYVATPGQQTLTVTLTQNINLAGLAVSAPGASGQQSISGFANGGSGGQLIRIDCASTHESTALFPVIINPSNAPTSGPGTITFSRSSQNTTIAVSGSIYTVTSTYTFTIDAASSSMSINLPDSALSSACMTVTDVPTCDTIDFNRDGSFFDPIDIDAFLSKFSEGPCIPANANCGDIDFNNDTSIFDPCDIDSFLLLYSEGPCTLCGQ